MTLESVKLEIQKKIRNTGAILTLKREELDGLRMDGEDKVNVFLNPGELPPIHNDQNLINRYNRLNHLGEKLSNIQNAYIDTLPRVSIQVMETYKKDLHNKLIDLEKEIEAI